TRSRMSSIVGASRSFTTNMGRHPLASLPSVPVRLGDHVGGADALDRPLASGLLRCEICTSNRRFQSHAVFDPVPVRPQQSGYRNRLERTGGPAIVRGFALAGEGQIVVDFLGSLERPRWIG